MNKKSLGNTSLLLQFGHCSKERVFFGIPSLIETIQIQIMMLCLKQKGALSCKILGTEWVRFS